MKYPRAVSFLSLFGILNRYIFYILSVSEGLKSKSEIIVEGMELEIEFGENTSAVSQEAVDRVSGVSRAGCLLSALCWLCLQVSFQHLRLSAVSVL